VAVDPLIDRGAEPGPRSPGIARAVILAGGRGTRLRPYTSILPKPLMPIGERSILEIVIEQLQRSGVVDVTLCVGYLSHLIRAVLDNRPDQSVPVKYVQEEGALGTAGPLRLVDGLEETFIVMNGDVLTTLDFARLLRYHNEQRNAVTIATHDRRIKIDYGVLHLDSQRPDARIRGFEEKPEVISAVSMGIYVIEPWVVELIPRGRRFDFPELIQRLLDSEQPVGAYRYDGMWFDIGREDDYELAVEAWEAASRNGNGHVDGKKPRPHTKRAAHGRPVSRPRSSTDPARPVGDAG
jgi:NDP-sugar pyrophosphorylase family protein